jgi:capsular polysaccharide biosynthesis protein
MSSSLGAGDDGPERPWLDEDVTGVEDRPADSAVNLVGLGFFTAALRRSAWFWRVTAAVGLLVGCGLYVQASHTYQASTTLLLTVGPEAQPGTAILDDQAIAQSHTVAGLTLRKLGLRQSVDSFIGSYTATPLTDRVLQITVSGPSSNAAVRRANALATEFLTFRAGQLEAEQQLEFTALDQQVTQAKQNLASISKQVSQLSAQPASSSGPARLSALREQEIRASNDLAVLEQQVSASDAATRVTTATMIGGSNVLDAAAPVPPHSRLKHLLVFVAGGFIIGLIVGMAIVVVRALLSDRLRRRDDVAQALGAPVKLSVPAMRANGRLPGRRGRVSDRCMQRIVAYLLDAVPAGPRAALAVVPVDDPQVAALSVVSLAQSCAGQGRGVVVADLCSGAPAAMLLGAKGPGVHTVSVAGARLVAAVPDPAEFAPIGPLRPTSPRAQPAGAGELAAACASADLLLTLITLDPSVGGEHLATWAPEAVVVVTAGRSSWTKTHAVGEMIRLAGTRLVSAVLVGADKTDESLGMAPAPEAGRAAVMAEGTQADADGPFARRPVGRPRGDGAVFKRPRDDGAAFRRPRGDSAVFKRPRGDGAAFKRPRDDSAVFKLQMEPPEHMGRRQDTGP